MEERGLLVYERGAVEDDRQTDREIGRGREGGRERERGGDGIGREGSTVL